MRDLTVPGAQAHDIGYFLVSQAVFESWMVVLDELGEVSQRVQPLSKIGPRQLSRD